MITECHTGLGVIATEKSWLIIPLLLISAGLHGASAGTLVVDQSGRAGFSTIREAVLSAEAGDVVEVLPGYYLEREIPVLLPITIVGTGGAVTLETAGDVAFRVEAGGSKISGIEIRGSRRGTGIELSSPGNSVEGCSILNFSTGIHSSASDNRVIGSSIRGTSVGLRVVGGAENAIVDSSISSSTGVEFLGSRGGVASNTTFSGDLGVLIDNSSKTAISGSAFLSATGIEFHNSSGNLVEGSFFTSSRGGVVLVGSAENEIRGNDISGSRVAAVIVSG
jgi:parallel beta-helix repeat protein